MKFRRGGVLDGDARKRVHDERSSAQQGAQELQGVGEIVLQIARSGASWHVHGEPKIP